MRYLQNRTALSFGLPLAITAILLLILNVFLVKKNADGDYIDNGLKFNSYKGVEVINHRNDIKAALQNLMNEYYPESVNNVDTSDTTEFKLVTDPDVIAKFNTVAEDRKYFEKAISEINKKITSHNNTRISGRLIGSIILILFPIYVLPISISFFRLHSYRWPISIITVFTAWTGIGYVLMLTWSAWPKGKFS